MKKTILLVEDEIIIALSEKISLEEYGYSVIIVESGEQAIESVESNPEIDLVLMDIDLGNGIDGTQAAEIILQKNELPIVFLSSHVEPEIVEKTDKITSYGYIVKNTSITIINASLKMAFRLFDAKKNEKEKEQSLIEAYRLNEQIIKNAQEGIIVYDNDLRYRVWNPYMEKLSGIPKDEILGRHPLEIMPFLEQNGMIDLLERALAGELVESVDFPFDFSESGKSGWVTDTSSTLRNANGDIKGVIGIVSNITKRKQAEDMVLQDEIRFHALFENAPLGYQSLDFDGNFIEVNQQWLDTLGYSREEVIGKWFGDFLTPANREGFIERFPIFKADGKIHSEFEMIHKNGKILFIAFEGKIGYELTGEFKQTHCILKDITKQREIDQKLKRELTEKRFLLKEVHHRIKNNINSIAAMISLKMDSKCTPQSLSVLQDTLGSINSLKVLYDKLLITEEYNDISVKNYVESLVESILALFPGYSKIKFTVKIDDFILSSKILFPLGIVINELLTNSMKYAFSDKDTGEIDINLSYMKNQISLIIQDDGKGLPEALNEAGNRGFGLMLVGMMSEQLGGEFKIESHMGTKCTLTFEY